MLGMNNDLLYGAPDEEWERVARILAEDSSGIGEFGEADRNIGPDKGLLSTYAVLHGGLVDTDFSLAATSYPSRYVPPIRERSVAFPSGVQRMDEVCQVPPELPAESRKDSEEEMYRNDHSQLTPKDAAFIELQAEVDRQLESLNILEQKKGRSEASKIAIRTLLLKLRDNLKRLLNDMKLRPQEQVQQSLKEGYKEQYRKIRNRISSANTRVANKAQITRMQQSLNAAGYRAAAAEKRAVAAETMTAEVRRGNDILIQYLGDLATAVIGIETPADLDVARGMAEAQQVALEKFKGEKRKRAAEKRSAQGTADSCKRLC